MQTIGIKRTTGLGDRIAYSLRGNKLGQDLRNAASNIWTGVKSGASGAASVVSGAFSAAGGMPTLAGLAGAFGAVAAVTGLVIAAFAGIIKVSNMLIDSQKRLAVYNPALMSAYIQSHLADIQRDRISAAATGGSAAELVRAMTDLRDAWRPFRDQLMNFLNGILAPILRWMAGLLKGIHDKYLGQSSLSSDPNMDIFRFYGSGDYKKERMAGTRQRGYSHPVHHNGDKGPPAHGIFGGIQPWEWAIPGIGIGHAIGNLIGGQ
jgi:hypothetical protein